MVDLNDFNLINQVDYSMDKFIDVYNKLNGTNLIKLDLKR